MNNTNSKRRSKPFKFGKELIVLRDVGSNKIAFVCPRGV